MDPPGHHMMLRVKLAGEGDQDSPGWGWQLVWLHLTVDYFASIAVEPVGTWQTSNLQQCFVWTAESFLPSTLCWLMLAWATSAGRHWRILPHLTDHSVCPHWSFSALSHLYRTTRLRQSSSRADRLSNLDTGASELSETLQEQLLTVGLLRACVNQTHIWLYQPPTHLHECLTPPTCSHGSAPTSSQRSP